MTKDEAIALFCNSLGDGMGKYSGPERDEEARCELHRGWGGFPYADEGYEWMDKVMTGTGGGSPATVVAALAGAVDTDALITPEKPHLQVWAAVGDWPYHIVMRNNAERTLMAYVEGDVTICVYDDDDAFKAAVSEYRAKHPCP